MYDFRTCIILILVTKTEVGFKYPHKLWIYISNIIINRCASRIDSNKTYFYWLLITFKVYLYMQSKMK